MILQESSKNTKRTSPVEVVMAIILACPGCHAHDRKRTSSGTFGIVLVAKCFNGDDLSVWGSNRNIANVPVLDTTARMSCRPGRGQKCKSRIAEGCEEICLSDLYSLKLVGRREIQYQPSQSKQYIAPSLATSNSTSDPLRVCLCWSVCESSHWRL